MRYLSDDGKVFNTEEECIDYEQSLKLKKEMEKDFEEIFSVYAKCLQLIELFAKKYNVPAEKIFSISNERGDYHETKNGFY